MRKRLGGVGTSLCECSAVVPAFEYGIRVAPSEDILYLNLGRTYIQLGKPDRARQVMQELLDHKPDSATAKRALQDLNGR